MTNNVSIAIRGYNHALPIPVSICRASTMHALDFIVSSRSKVIFRTFPNLDAVSSRPKAEKLPPITPPGPVIVPCFLLWIMKPEGSSILER